MSVEHLVSFNIALLIALVSPGPALLVAIQTSLSGGRRAGISVGCGLGLMAATWTMSALLGLEVIFKIFPWLYATARFIGGVYLVYIAWKMWLGSRDKVNVEVGATRHSFKQGIMINLLNPKAVLFAAAVLVLIFPNDMTLFECAIIALNHLVVEVPFYVLLATVMNAQAVKTRYLGAKVYIDRTASLILAALSLRILIIR